MTQGRQNAPSRPRSMAPTTSQPNMSQAFAHLIDLSVLLLVASSRLDNMSPGPSVELSSKLVRRQHGPMEAS